MKMAERWKDIPGYEGLYKASSLGRIKALKKIRYFGKYAYNKRVYPEKLMKFRKSNNGYFLVTLCKDGVSIGYLVHRLITLTFHKNPLNKRTVNHKNSIKTDNRAVNLEWNSHKENSQHALNSGKYTNLFHGTKDLSKAVICTKTRRRYSSIIEAAKHNNIKLRSLYEQLAGTQKNKTTLKLI